MIFAELNTIVGAGYPEEFRDLLIEQGDEY
jgi:hypothetical protein